MRPWLKAMFAKLSAKSDTATSMRYAPSRWRALTCYVNDEQLEIDNNGADQELCVVAIDRKNFLYARSAAGGDRAAAMYSLLGSTEFKGLDPEIYLHHLLGRIADRPTSTIHDLLPWKLALPTRRRGKGTKSRLL